MDTEFSIKVNLAKAGQAFLMGAIPAAMLCADDALKNGNLDLRKVGIGFSLSFALGGLRSLQNWLKNRVTGVADPGK